MRIFANYSRLDYGTRKGRAQIMGALCAFMGAPGRARLRLVEAGVREFTSASDFPDKVTQLIETYSVQDEELDLGWQQVFDTKNFLNTTESGYKIGTTGTGLTFKKLLPGEPARVYAVEGTEVDVTFDAYGGALEFLDIWLADQQWWKIEDRAGEFRYQWYDDQANIIWALLDAITAGQNTAWQGAVADDAVVRDIQTIDSAIASIIADLDGTGIPCSGKSRFVCVAPEALRGRIGHALSMGHSKSGVDRREIEYTVAPVFTQKLDATNVYYVGLPGKKAQVGLREDLTIETSRNILVPASLAAGHGRYGGAIANEDQFRRCSIA